MKHNYSLALAWVALALFAQSAAGQAPPQAGFVLVNATGQKEKAKLTADGKDILAGGLESGGATSGIPLPVGLHQIQVSVPPLAPASVALTTALGTSPILVAYVEEVLDPQSKATKRILRLTPLPQRPQTGKYLTSIVSFASLQPISVQVNHQAVTLEYKKPFPAEGRRFLLAHDGKDVLETEYSEKSSQFCIVFRDAENNLQAILVPDMVYTW
ncbi:MAG: hypothetical protein ACR2ID_00650 [Chthoniobacterales bacterium]